MISRNKKIVFTNGTFQLIHAGHIDLFIRIRNIFPSDQYKLVVGINSDDSIKRIKGRDTPINQFQRKFIIESIKYVDDVIIFDEDTPSELIQHIMPDYIVKGSDYLGKEVVGSEFAKAVVLINFYRDISTTKIYEKIKEIDI